MPAVACLNGVWQAPGDARVSVLDRGFMFGDGVYEVIPVYGGRPFTLDRHLDRLDRSLDEVRISRPHSRERWVETIEESISRCGEPLATVYVQVTRGVAEIRSHLYPEHVEPTVLVLTSPAPILARHEITPYNLITLDDFRWSRGHIKTISLIAAGMLKNEARARGADDAILVRDGRVTEATSSNVFVAIGGRIVTPPKSNLLLHGITRDVVVELCRESGVPVEEREIRVEELRSADEIMVTSSSHEVWPVGTLDGVTVGNGEAGVLWQQLDRLFQSCKTEVCGMPEKQNS